MADHPMVVALKSLTPKQLKRLKYDFAHGGRKLKSSFTVEKDGSKSLMSISEKDVKRYNKLVDKGVSIKESVLESMNDAAEEMFIDNIMRDLKKYSRKKK
jgi:hypothetical protein